MTPFRLPGGRILAVACVLVGAGLSEAAAQFPPPPGQTAPAQAGGSPFPPPPGAPQSSPFPPPPGQGQAPAQDPAFPPPGSSRPTSITVGPSGGSGGFGPPGGGSFAPPGGGGGFSGPAPQPSEAQKVCLTFPALREDVEKGAAVIKAASARKATREEVCPIFKSFAV